MLKNILILDDDETTLRIVELTLVRFKFVENVIKRTSVVDALKYFEQLSVDGGEAVPDLIFLDVCMPTMNGWDFLEKYTQRFEMQFPSISICMLSSSVDPDDLQKAKIYPQVIAFVDKFHLVKEMDMLRKHANLKHLFVPVPT